MRQVSVTTETFKKRSYIVLKRYRELEETKKVSFLADVSNGETDPYMLTAAKSFRRVARSIEWTRVSTPECQGLVNRYLSAVDDFVGKVETSLLAKEALPKGSVARLLRLHTKVGNRLSTEILEPVDMEAWTEFTGAAVDIWGNRFSRSVKELLPRLSVAANTKM